MNPLINNAPAMNIGQLYMQVMQNPRAFLDRLGVPSNITTPQGAVQYLLQSGKINQSQVEQAQRQVQKEVEQIKRNQPITEGTNSSVHRTDV